MCAVTRSDLVILYEERYYNKKECSLDALQLYPKSQPHGVFKLEELMIALQQLKDQGHGQQDQPETRQQPVGHEMASYQGPNQGIQNQQVAVSFFSEEHRLPTKQLGKICYSLCILIIMF